ncbi:MAG TPA: nucleotidyl transferase AbiEii/AbiGii toxin family protein [Steroidobacteraceae bacterium]|nr:nucleotidyl transferase AbiEii/AbiGii toxin family protein [Steroidobacteraceae bacterium]
MLGKERSSTWATLRLAVRNAAKPSRILRCIYKIPSVSETGRELTLEVETNVTERLPKRELQRLPFEVEFRGQRLQSALVSYNINEMLATKMRALFQRRRGRDLFDLYWALTAEAVEPVDVADVMDAFQHYMRSEDTRVPRTEFIAHLRTCLADKAGFCTDMIPLLRRGVKYDPAEAGLYLEAHVLSRLPE